MTCDIYDPEPHAVDPYNETEEERLIRWQWRERNDEAISQGKHFSNKPGYVPESPGPGEPGYPDPADDD
jgi:hypothetical protein